MSKKSRCPQGTADKGCCRHGKCGAGRAIAGVLLALGIAGGLAVLVYWLGHPGSEEEHGTIS